MSMKERKNGRKLQIFRFQGVQEGDFLVLVFFDFSKFDEFLTLFFRDYKIDAALSFMFKKVKNEDSNFIENFDGKKVSILAVFVANLRRLALGPFSRNRWWRLLQQTDTRKRERERPQKSGRARLLMSTNTQQSILLIIKWKMFHGPYLPSYPHPKRSYPVGCRWAARRNYLPARCRPWRRRCWNPGPRSRPGWVGHVDSVFSSGNNMVDVFLFNGIEKYEKNVNNMNNKNNMKK